SIRGSPCVVSSISPALDYRCLPESAVLQRMSAPHSNQRRCSHTHSKPSPQSTHHTTPQHTSPHHTSPHHTSIHLTTPHLTTPHYNSPHHTTPHTHKDTETHMGAWTH